METEEQERQMKSKRKIYSVFTHGIPGARESIFLLFSVLSVFFVAVVLSSFLFIKAIQVGDYAESVIRSKTGFIVIFWALVWLASFVYSMRTALQIAGRVAGPIRRMEHLMDEILNGKEVRINLRKEDALNGVAQRINQLLELQKHLAMKEPRNQ